MSAAATNVVPTTPVTAANMGSDLKPAGEASAAVKPCCVCKSEKAARDECMLFSNAPDPQHGCESAIDKYRACMRGFGFEMR